MSGWIKLHRRITDSDIYQMPPLYLRVFERLILEANHQDNEIPYKEKGSKVVGKKLIKRGERLTSVRDICKWVAWYERGKLKVPNPKTIQNILDWLEENNMIEIYGKKGNRKETHYKVVNYGVYQGSDDDKVTEKKQLGNSQVTVTGDKQECIRMIKNDKEDEEEGDKENPFSFYQNNFGTISSFIAKRIGALIDDIGSEMVIEAMKIARLNKATSFRYVEAIANDWLAKNIRTPEDLKAFEAEKQRSKNQKQDKPLNIDYEAAKKSKYGW